MGSYRVEVDSRARKEIRELPGHVRQRILRAIRDLAADPHPHTSRPLETHRAGLDLPSGLSLHRVRIESWRVVYLVEEDRELVTVLAVRQRPPYQYTDLAELLIRE
jgi:mRNA interferase RelE/StbE